MPETATATWTEPDARGVCICDLDVRAKSTLRGKRLCRSFSATPVTLGSWPTAWQELLADWIKASSPKRKWSTLLTAAGNRRVHLADELLGALLRGGWVEVEEWRKSGRWLPVWVNFLDLATLRHHFSLPDKEMLAETFRIESLHTLQDSRLTHAQQSLDAFSLHTALRRLALLRKLDIWLIEQRFGTRRDFSLFARGTTKAISTAEWEWLERYLDPVEWGIEKHTPALWLRAPIVLLREDLHLDLSLVDDCIALTPGTLNSLTGIKGRIGCWRLLENRTSFERAARRYGNQDLVVWLPGYAPPCGRQSVTRFLTLCPAPALIACDPDPAGIEIALQAARIWDEAGLSWQPWGMDVETLSGLPNCQPLSQNDREQLQRLLQQPLPVSLQVLADWMLIHAKKGEQEGAI